MPASPTQRTLKRLRERGMVAGVVEKWIPQTKRRLDLYGFIDVIGCGEGPVLAVQATSGSNGASRVEKITGPCAEQAKAWLRSGGAIEVHAWRKLKKRKDRKWWHPRVWQITLLHDELCWEVRS